MALAIFLLEREQTDATERPTPTHAGGYTAGVGNNRSSLFRPQRTPHTTN